jgi:hypothetical protein
MVIKEKENEETVLTLRTGKNGKLLYYNDLTRKYIPLDETITNTFLFENNTVSLA